MIVFIFAAALFNYIGKFYELSYVIKSPPGRNALRRNGMMSLKRPAAGGESRERDSFLLRHISSDAGTVIV